MSSVSRRGACIHGVLNMLKCFKCVTCKNGCSKCSRKVVEGELKVLKALDVFEGVFSVPKAFGRCQRGPARVKRVKVGEDVELVLTVFKMLKQKF